MSLDSLFEQILLSEQQLTEQTQQIKAVTAAIYRCNEKIHNATETCEKTSEELEEKAQQLSTMRLQYDLMKKCHDQMLKQIEGLLCPKDRLTECLAKVKRDSEEEERHFLEEISQFNRDFSLRGDSEVVLENQMHVDILDLEREVDSLHKEMELMSCRGSHTGSVQEEKGALRVELQHLENIQKDLDRQLEEAEAMTDCLRAERLFVSQKPLTDGTCLRLRKELEMHKEGELDLQREALDSEIQFVKTKLASRQGSEQN